MFSILIMHRHDDEKIINTAEFEDNNSLRYFLQNEI